MSDRLFIMVVANSIQQFSRHKCAWLNQNRCEIEELYGQIVQFRNASSGTFLSNLTFERFLDFVVRNSQTYINPYLPTETAVRLRNANDAMLLQLLHGDGDCNNNNNNGSSSSSKSSSRASSPLSARLY